MTNCRNSTPMRSSGRSSRGLASARHCQDRETFLRPARDRLPDCRQRGGSGAWSPLPSRLESGKNRRFLLHLDATFDNSLKRYGTKGDDYYNLEDRQLFRDHQPLIALVPACTKSDAFYYRVNRLSLTKTEEVGKRLKAVLRKKQPCFVFHWRGGALNRSILEEILKEAEAAAAAKEKHVRLSVNVPQAVIQVNFVDQPVGEEILTEEANEGEEGG